MSAVGEAFAPAAGALDRFAAQHENDLRARGLPISGYAVPVGPGTSRRMVMRREARCELGGSVAPSAAAVVLREGAGPDAQAVEGVSAALPISWDSALCDRVAASDMVLTMGRSMQSRRRAAPFALVLELWAPAWGDDAYDRLTDELRAPDWVEGCMLAVSGDTARLRPSRACLRAGFDEAQLGWILVELARSVLPDACCVRVLLVVDDEQAVAALGETARCAVEAGRALRRERYGRRGVDVDCPSGILHCGACKDKDTCASVRRIERRRRDLKEGRQSCMM